MAVCVFVRFFHFLNKIRIIILKGNVLRMEGSAKKMGNDIQSMHTKTALRQKEKGYIEREEGKRR